MVTYLFTQNRILLFLTSNPPVYTRMIFACTISPIIGFIIYVLLTQFGINISKILIICSLVVFLVNGLFSAIKYSNLQRYYGKRTNKMIVLVNFLVSVISFILLVLGIYLQLIFTGSAWGHYHHPHHHHHPHPHHHHHPHPHHHHHK